MSFRKTISAMVKYFSFFVTLMAIVTLTVLLIHIFKQGWDWLDVDFLTSFPSRHPEKAGIKSAIYGTVWMLVMTAAMAVPLGIATAIYLEEYAPPKNPLIRLVRANISNLAGMPSIVYGLLGLALFVRYFEFEQSLLAGSLTLALLILPIIIISSSKAIVAVPNSLREAAYALGAHKWQVILFQILPAAFPGILTGIILGNARAIGESAPLLMVGALSYVAFVPESPLDPFTVLPVQIFNWASRPQDEFHGLAGAGIIALLVILFVMNSGAMYLRHKFGKYQV